MMACDRSVLSSEYRLKHRVLTLLLPLLGVRLMRPSTQGVASLALGYVQVGLSARLPCTHILPYQVSLPFSYVSVLVG